MQEYRKLLCVNKIRETKRLIENMLIPILSLVVAVAVVGYQIVIKFFPIIRKINASVLQRKQRSQPKATSFMTVQSVCWKSEITCLKILQVPTNI